MNTAPIELRRYRRPDGTVPVTRWLSGLRDARVRAKVEIRLRRVSAGLFGDCRPIGGGAFELREDIGVGYRIYAGRRDRTVILLCGGDKRTQAADIQRAKDYWMDWKQRNV
jgi:putative addiction module killer protein